MTLIAYTFVLALSAPAPCPADLVTAALRHAERQGDDHAQVIECRDEGMHVLARTQYRETWACPCGDGQNSYARDAWLDGGGEDWWLLDGLFIYGSAAVWISVCPTCPTSIDVDPAGGYVVPTIHDQLNRIESALKRIETTLKARKP